MEIWALFYFLYIDHRAHWSCRGRGGGGGSSPQVKNPLGDHLKFKSRCHFQYDTTKSLSISEAIHKNKIMNLNSKLLFCSHFAF